MLWMICVLALSLGCVQPRYFYGRDRDSRLPKQDGICPPILAGGPQPQLDRLEAAVHWPSKRLRAMQQAIAQRIPALRDRTPAGSQEEAVRAAARYLEDNGLNEVIVESRHYDPEEQWKRLLANPHSHPFWKYTDGALRVSTYALLPARVFHIDTYNPYTHTLSINSARPASAVFQAARAKEFSATQWPGLYAAGRYVPIVPLGQEMTATSDALTYARDQEDSKLEHELYPWTYAWMVSSAATGSVAVVPEASSSVLLAGPIANVAGLMTGSIAGEVVAERVDLQRESDQRAIPRVLR